MNQPLYIAPDEEIISVIARLRTLPESAVTLVFPKHSVVTQSIINLKLLAREGEKLQKQLTLVSQNENARSLAEKIGFATLPYTQEMEKGNLYLQGVDGSEVAPPPPPLASIPPVTEMPMPEGMPSESLKPKSRDIGTSAFYTKEAVPNGSEGKNMGDIKRETEWQESIRIQNGTPAPDPSSTPLSATTLRVRNMSPERPPSLNSLRTTPTPQAQDMSVQSTVSSPIFPDSYAPSVAGATPPPTAISDFFNRKESATASVRMPEQKIPPIPMPPLPFSKKEAILKKPTPVMVGNTVSSKLTKILVALVIILVVTTGALGFFLVFPRATVTVNPQTITDAYDQSFTVSATTGSDEVPLTKRTEEVTVNIAGIASGAAGTTTSSGSRAKGTIKITNSYGSEPQPLVASTRFESPSGKIYRIQENITVPGNGSIDAIVVADGSGESYNMSEGNFTIPGFKGTDKYEKFSATVTQAITGGGGNETMSSGTFIRADEETLRSRALEEAKSMFSERIDNEAGDTYTFTDGLQAERISESNLPKVGSNPGEYQYSAVVKITAFTTSKEAVTKAVIKNIRSQYDGIAFTPITQELSFADFSLNEAGTEASLKVHLDTLLAAEVNEGKIKEDLAGKGATELENFTTAHPEIKGLSIHFNPSWALKRIPKNPDKIEIVTENAE